MSLQIELLASMFSAYLLAYFTHHLLTTLHVTDVPVARDVPVPQQMGRAAGGAAGASPGPSPPSPGRPAGGRGQDCQGSPAAGQADGGARDRTGRAGGQ